MFEHIYLFQCYQQYKDFEGHGFLSDKQLEYVANKMGWEENVQTNSVRIVIMHHHYKIGRAHV